MTKKKSKCDRCYYKYLAEEYMHFLSQPSSFLDKLNIILIINALFADICFIVYILMFLF